MSVHLEALLMFEETSKVYLSPTLDELNSLGLVLVSYCLVFTAGDNKNKNKTKTTKNTRKKFNLQQNYFFEIKKKLN